MSLLRCLMPGLAISLVLSCTTELPAVDPGLLACTDDRPLASGEDPCPETHWCSEAACRPRLECETPGLGRPGCQDDPTRPSPTRCEAVFGARTAAVRCESGTHTATSARPADPDRCACPDGTRCVAFARSSPGDFPLFVLPEGGALPTGVLGITGEVEDRRLCARACSSEANCPPDHTCRPAAVLGGDLLAAVSGRHTIAVCYPNRLTSTSTTAPIVQPDPNGCLQPADCPVVGLDRPVCQYEVRLVADHPLVPAGPAWTERRALVARCISGGDSGLLNPGLGCELERASLCESGLCLDGRCAALCDPARPEVACERRRCIAREATRVLPDGRRIVDRVHVCER
jgi:hypothetical protein